MNTCTISELGTLQQLVSQAHGTDEPVVVFDGEDECLVAMRPAVFERMLFDVDSLARAGRKTLHL